MRKLYPHLFLEYNFAKCTWQHFYSFGATPTTQASTLEWLRGLTAHRFHTVVNWQTCVEDVVTRDYLVYMAGVICNDFSREIPGERTDHFFLQADYLKLDLF